MQNQEVNQKIITPKILTKIQTLEVKFVLEDAGAKLTG
jgi:hypothetical protein